LNNEELDKDEENLDEDDEELREEKGLCRA
jgi:hypothetical protein